MLLGAVSEPVEINATTMRRPAITQATAPAIQTPRPFSFPVPLTIKRTYVFRRPLVNLIGRLGTRITRSSRPAISREQERSGLGVGAGSIDRGPSGMTGPGDQTRNICHFVLVDRIPRSEPNQQITPRNRRHGIALRAKPDALLMSIAAMPAHPSST